MAKEMTVEEAVRIIKETVEFGDKFDEAVSYLKENDPQNHVLVPFTDKVAQDKIKKERAKAYLVKATAEEDFDERYDEALKLVRGDKKLQAQVAEEQEVYDRENHLDMKDEEAILFNTRKISNIVDSFEDDEQNKTDLAELKGKVDIVDDNTGDVVTPEEAQAYWDSLLESAKQQATMLRAGDLNFFKKKEEEKRQTLNRDIKDFLAIGVARGVAGSAMDMPKEEVEFGSKDYDKYIRKQADKAEKEIDKLFGEGKQKAKIKASFFLTEAVATSKKMASYAHRWLQKGFKRVASIFKEKKEYFDNTMKGLLGKRYEIAHMAEEYAKNNKWRLIVDTAATGVVALTAVTGVFALPAVAAYAAYTAGGAWTWPLVEKKTKAIREAKKSGKDTSEWTGFKGLKKAYAEIKADEKEYKNYKNKAFTGTAFGIAGAGVVTGIGMASGWMVDATGYLTAKVASSAIRSTGSITSQFLNYRDTKKDFAADPSAENRARLKQAKLGLGLGATIAFAGNLMGFSHLTEANAAEHVSGVASNLSDNTGIAATDSTSVAGVDSTAVPGGVGNDSVGSQDVPVNVDVEPVMATAPEAWDASMGISEKHWAEMQEKLTGIYENHSEIFGRENVSSEEAWNKMYQNLTNARAANPEYFGDMTNEQWLYKYMKLIESTERVTRGPEGFLVTKLGADGLPMYSTKELQETLRAMNGMLNCGEKFDVSADKVATVMGYIDEKTGRYMGPGADIGVTNNRYIGGRAGCGDDYQNAWKHARSVVQQHHTPVVPKATPVVEQPAPAPVAEPTPVPAPKSPVAAEEVITNNVPEQQPTHVSEEVVNKKSARVTVVLNESATDGNAEVGKYNSRVHGKFSRLDTGR